MMDAVAAAVQRCNPYLNNKQDSPEFYPRAFDLLNSDFYMTNNLLIQVWRDEVVGWLGGGRAQDPLGVASTKVRTKSLKELLNSFLRTLKE